MLPIPPWGHVPPVVVKPLLYDLHMFLDGLLGILLHPAVQGGIHGESVSIEVQFVVGIISWYKSHFAQVIYVPYQFFAEVRSQSVITALCGMRHQLYGQILDGISLFGRSLLPIHLHMSMGIHQIQNRIASTQTIARIDAGIVAAGSLQESHEHSSLLMSEFVGGGAEIGTRRGLDAEGVAPEVHGIEIHGQDILLLEYDLQFGSHYPLLGFHHQKLHPGNMSEQPRGILCTHTEEVLGQLLCDGTGPTGSSSRHILHGSKESCHVYTMMLIESLVLCINKCLNEHRRYLVILHGRTVLAEVPSKQHAIGTVDFRSLAYHRFFYVGKAW